MIHRGTVSPESRVLAVMAAADWSGSISSTWDRMKQSTATGMAAMRTTVRKTNGFTGNRRKRPQVRAGRKISFRITSLQALGSMEVSASSFRVAPRERRAVPLAMFHRSFRVSSSHTGKEFSPVTARVNPARLDSTRGFFAMLFRVPFTAFHEMPPDRASWAQEMEIIW